MLGLAAKVRRVGVIGQMEAVILTRGLRARHRDRVAVVVQGRQADREQIRENQKVRENRASLQNANGSDGS
jgi:hypothetical protein